MNALASRIAEIIAAQGPLSIAQYMSHCLHDPDYGAYASRETIGGRGDFITAPEVSQMYGELCGLWVVQSWHNQDRPAHPLLVELGPGRGTLMHDALRAITAALPEFIADVQIVLVETSPVFEAIQREKLKEMGAKISWTKRFGEANADNRPLYLLANEFFDCMPVHQYVKTAQGWCEKMVTLKDGALAFALSPDPVPPSLIPPGRENAPDGGTFEIAPAGLALIEEISRALAAWGGSALIVDYGYDAPGFGETLQAVSAHEFVDVLAKPGASDISAHVDFPALAEAAQNGGAKAYGPAGQGDFLMKLGIEARTERLMIANREKARDIVAAAKRLIGEDEMGRLFKAMALAPATAPVPPGFETSDPE